VNQQVRNCLFCWIGEVDLCKGNPSRIFEFGQFTVRHLQHFLNEALIAVSSKEHSEVFVEARCNPVVFALCNPALLGAFHQILGHVKGVEQRWGAAARDGVPIVPLSCHLQHHIFGIPKIVIWFEQFINQPSNLFLGEAV
jgi:hypothetical protein